LYTQHDDPFRVIADPDLVARDPRQLPHSIHLPSTRSMRLVDCARMLSSLTIGGST
jgi:hypothetical protein